jgi:hypothetical protein
MDTGRTTGSHTVRRVLTEPYLSWNSISPQVAKTKQGGEEGVPTAGDTMVRWQELLPDRISGYSQQNSRRAARIRHPLCQLASLSEVPGHKETPS